MLDFEPDDLPAGYPDMWSPLVDALRTHRVVPVSGQRLGVVMKAPDAEERRKARYKTEEWKAQHRIHAREHARRKRAARKEER